MSGPRRDDYLEHIERAVADALAFTDKLTRDDFLANRMVQQAVIMSLIIIGEAVARLLAQEPDFAAAHPGIAWNSIRGMRNRLAHGYFEIDMDIVWTTVRAELPRLGDFVRSIRR